MLVHSENSPMSASANSDKHSPHAMDVFMLALSDEISLPLRHQKIGQARLQKVSGLSRNQQVDVGGANCSNHCIFDQLPTDRQLSHPQ